MTSAARPTWAPAVGGAGTRDGSSSAPTLQYCRRDQPGHKVLKLRQPGQAAPSDLQARDLRRELLLGEASEHPKKTLKYPQDIDGDYELDKDSEHEHSPSQKIDEDGTTEEEASDDDYDELLRELEKIKTERETKRQRIEAEKTAIETARRDAQILVANPLLNLARPNANPKLLSVEEFALKRRWTDDVVFKNQTRGIDDKPKKRFINDTTRSDFHRKFIEKYIR